MWWYEVKNLHFKRYKVSQPLSRLTPEDGLSLHRPQFVTLLSPNNGKQFLETC